MKRMNKYWLSLGLATVCAASVFNAAAVGMLPDKVCFSVTAEAGYGAPSYQDLTMYIDGQAQKFDSWCIAANVHIEGNFLYTAQLLSPAEAAGLVVHPENFDLVAWILNQNYPGQASPSGGTYTSGDVQMAIWLLIDDEVGDDMGPWDPTRVAEILAAAAANGEGFVPNCGERAIVVLKPVLAGCDLSTTATDPVTQPIMITVPAQCGPGTGTPGYWMNHPEAWPVEQIEVGGIIYSKADAIAKMLLPVKNDKRLTLFPALVCAKLNVIIGNDPSCVADTITLADAWWAMYNAKAVKASSDAWEQGEPLYCWLDAYNNGLLCAPHRD
jgi:hypothetical protein